MLEHLANWIINTISSWGYFGILATMAIESALIPLPSEIIMPFSGYLASLGRFSLLGVATAGAVGNLLGSLLAYALGYWGNERVVRRLIRRWGRFVLITEDELDLAVRLLNKYKDGVVLGSRVVPGIRTVISLPCGMARLPLGRFIVLTFVGSFLWSFFLAWIGFVLGANWKTLGPWFHKLDAVIVIFVVAAIGSYVWRKLKKK